MKMKIAEFIKYDGETLLEIRHTTFREVSYFMRRCPELNACTLILKNETDNEVTLF